VNDKAADDDVSTKRTRSSHPDEGGETARARVSISGSIAEHSTNRSSVETLERSIPGELDASPGSGNFSRYTVSVLSSMLPKMRVKPKVEVLGEQLNNDNNNPHNHKSKGSKGDRSRLSSSRAKARMQVLEHMELESTGTGGTTDSGDFDISVDEALAEIPYERNTPSSSAPSGDDADPESQQFRVRRAHTSCTKDRVRNKVPVILDQGAKQCTKCSHDVRPTDTHSNADYLSPISKMDAASIFQRAPVHVPNEFPHPISCETSTREPSFPSVPGSSFARQSNLNAALKAAWDCNFATAERLLEADDKEKSLARIWAARTEISLLKAVMMGEINEFMKAIEYSWKVVEHSTGDLRDRTLVAEVTVWRGIIQCILGQTFRACWNLRSAFLTLKKLHREPELATMPGARSRVRTGLGICYIGVFLCPSSYRPWVLRLLGFPTDEKQNGYTFLKEEALESEGRRNILCALVLALYHLDLDPNLGMVRDTIVANLRLAPQCPLLHWVASICAWRHGEIFDACFLLKEALKCCSGLDKAPVYLRYELGMLKFVEKEYETCIELFVPLYECEGILFPFKAMIPLVLCAANWALGNIVVGDAYALEAIKTAQSSLEVNLCKVVDVARKRDEAGKSLFAVEACYLLRIFTRLPQSVLRSYVYSITYCEAKKPAMKHMVYVQLIHVVTLFHLGDYVSVKEVVPRLEEVAAQAKESYYRVHGLYWCSRIWHLLGDNKRALNCAFNAKKAGRKRHPFEISHKIQAFMDTIPKSP